MKYVFQLMIIMGVSLVGEILHTLLPLPVPASVYGLLLLLFLLMTRIVKLSQIEETASYLISIMPLFFIEPSVAIMNSVGVVKGSLLPVIITCFLTVITVIGVTGLTAQAVIRIGKKKGGKKDKTDES